MLAGAMDFLTKPFTSEELTSSIHRVYEMGASRRAAMPAMPTTDAGRPMGPAGAQGPARKVKPGGKLLMIYSPKGGTGCSTVATNLAIAMEQASSKKIALVDASLQFGNVDVMLNLQGDRTIADAIARIDELDNDLLNIILSPHPSGIKVLAAPASPELAETIGGAELKKLLALMVRNFDYVILDTWRYLDDIVLATIDVADRIMLVLTPEIPSIKGTKQFFEVAEALEIPVEQIDLVLNMVIPRDGIRADQLANSMHHEILAQLDYDPRSMRLAVNQGLPLIMAQPNHPLSERFVELARQEMSLLDPQAVVAVEETPEPVEEEPKKRAGLFGRLRK
jgi:pilus assembly protein CpaE